MWTKDLFAPLNQDIRADLSHYVAGLHAVLAKGGHARDLPRAIRDLSRLMTSERKDRQSGYLRQPWAVSAYLNYFLPWNLYRLTRLLPSLDLPLPGENAVILDLGSGPLTGPQALWISRPDLRARPLTFICLDRSARVMRTGLETFQKITANQSAWQIKLIEGDLRGLAASLKGDLILSLNVLNEVMTGPDHLVRAELTKLAAKWFGLLKPDGRMLLVEPGTRLGGRILSLARQAGLEQGFKVLGPCTHAQACPMLQKGSTSWCHFRARTSEAPPPDSLAAISGLSKLDKDEISLSLLVLTRASTPPALPAHPATLTARVLSRPFSLTGHEGRFCYACASPGLVCVPARMNNRSVAPGDIIHGRLPEQPKHDPKTGRPILEVNDKDKAEAKSKEPPAAGGKGRFFAKKRPFPPDPLSPKKLNKG